MDSVSFTGHAADARIHTGSIGYVCDVENHKIVYLSKECMVACGLETPEELKSQPCYTLLWSRSTPCEFCNRGESRNSGELRWKEHYNEKLGRWFDVTDSSMSLAGNTCRLKIAWDITSSMTEQRDNPEKHPLEAALLECLYAFEKQHGMEEEIHLILQSAGRYYQAERVCVMEMHGQWLKTVFAWNAPNAAAGEYEYKDIPFAVADGWLKKLSSNGLLSIMEQTCTEEEAELLQNLGLHGFMAAPRHRSEQLVGLVTVENPGRFRQDTQLLHAVESFLLEAAERHQLKNDLLRERKTDSLTGLKNRNRYAGLLQRYEANPPAALGVILLDVNGLHAVNETYGYAYGDYVLTHVAEILKSFFSKGLYRIGSDEFAVLCSNLSREDFQKQVGSLRKRLEEDKICDISLGFAWSFDREAVDVNGLIQQAEDILQSEKQTYYHTAFTEGRTITRKNFASEVLEELKQGQFVVYYQPQVSIETGSVTGVEALVRKKTERGELVSPGNFIPLYEAGDVISHVDLFVMRTACEALRQWSDQGYSLRVSLNFSRKTLLESHVAETMRKICKECGIPPAWITVEVTESIGKIEHSNLKKLLVQLKEAGFRISLDDFGSAYSNLTLLANLDFDEVKFDKTMIAALEHNERSRIILEHSVQLCRALQGSSILAEGVETKEQLEYLKKCRCDNAQGYYYSRPLSKEGFQSYLAEMSSLRSRL